MHSVQKLKIAAVLTLIGLSEVGTPTQAQAESTPSGLTVTTAKRMAAACIAYARMHQRAANIWVYDTDGQVVHFERMGGAPLIGAPPGTPGNTVFGVAIDPNSLEPADPGDAPVRVAGQMIGRVRVAGMGSTLNHACAEAAAAAARLPLF